MEVVTVSSNSSTMTGITTASQVSQRMKKHLKKKKLQKKSRPKPVTIQADTVPKPLEQTILGVQNLDTEVPASQKSRGDTNSHVAELPSPILPVPKETSANQGTKKKTPFIGNLLNLADLTNDQQTAILDLLTQAPSPKSDSEQRPREISFKTQVKSDEPEVIDLTKSAGCTPDGIPIRTDIPLTPQQLAVLDYMSKIRQLTPDVKEVKRSSLPSGCKFDGTIAKFSVYRNVLEGHYRQQQAAYLFNEDFIAQYLEYGPSCYVNFKGCKSELQVQMDVEALFGAIQQSCATPETQAIIIKHSKPTPNGVAAWKNLVEEYGSSGAKEIREDELEEVVNTHYSPTYKGGLAKWVQDYKNAFAELDAIDDRTFADDERKKKRILKNFAGTNSQLGMVLKELCAGKSFAQTCRVLRTHGLAGGSVKPARQIKATSKLNELVDLVADKVNANMFSASPMDLGDSQVLESLVHLSRIDNDLWRKLPRDVQQVIIDHRRKENDQKPAAASSEPQKPKSGDLPRQYTKANNTKVEPNEELIQEYLSQVLEMDDDNDLDSEILETHANITRVRVTDADARRCMNSLSLGDPEKVVIMDNGADTCVIGKGWHIAHVHPTRKADVIGFDHHMSVKKNLDIVAGIGAIDSHDGVILLQINEAVYNPTADHSLLSEFQIREHRIEVDSVPRRHGGKQMMKANDREIWFGVMDCLVHFKIRTPTNEELEQLTPIQITDGDRRWNPRLSTFSSPIDHNLANLEEASLHAYQAHLRRTYPILPPHLTRMEPLGNPVQMVHHSTTEDEAISADTRPRNITVEDTAMDTGPGDVPLQENTQEQGGIIPFPESESRSFDPSDPSSDLGTNENPMPPTFVDPYYLHPISLRPTLQIHAAPRND